MWGVTSGGVVHLCIFSVQGFDKTALSNLDPEFREGIFRVREAQGMQLIKAPEELRSEEVADTFGKG